MAEDQAPRYPVIRVSDAGLPDGLIRLHDESTGRSIIAENTATAYREGTEFLSVVRSLTSDDE